MKILFYTNYYYPHIGGVEKHVEKLSAELVKAGHVITIITSRYDLKLAKRISNRSIRIIRIPTPKIKYLGLFTIWIYQFIFLTRLIKEQNVVHCHDVFLWYLPFRFIFPRKPVYVTFHGYEKYPIKKKFIYLRKLSEFLTKGNICVGAFLKKWYGTHPNFVIYGAVDNKFKRKLIRKYTYDAVFWGRLDEQTDILKYDKTVSLLRKKNIYFRWLVIGEGEYKKKIGSFYKIVPFRRNIEKAIYLSKFAFVSRYLSILEALISKKFVIAFYSTPIKKDYLVKTPFSKYIFTVSTPTQAQNIICDIRKNPEKYIKKINNGYRWAKSQTWKKITEKYLCLWESKKMVKRF